MIYQLGSGSLGTSSGTGLFDSSSQYITYTSSWDTTAGTETKVETTKDKKNCISTKLYMTYVKSKLSKIELSKLKKRLTKLKHMVPCVHEMGQRALYEALCSEIANIVRESELVACGIDKYLDIEVINKYIHNLKEGTVVKLKDASDFPRVMPADIRKVYKHIKSTKLFSEFKILYTDYTGKELKTNKEKIREKDPILFGVIPEKPNTLYFIADWIDEYCDLTLDKLVSKIRLDDPEFKLNEIPPISDDRLNDVIKANKERDDRLKDAKPDNFKDLMVEEDVAAETTPATKKEKAKKKKWFGCW